MITVVTPTSPIKSHPDPGILFETLDSIRHHLPDAEIILTFDGVRPEHRGRRRDYEEFIRLALIRARQDHAICPFLFEEHRHQSGMMRAILEEIKTPLLLYVEADTPLVTEPQAGQTDNPHFPPIDWEEIECAINSGMSNVVRLHHEAAIPDPHQHLMHGLEIHERWFPRVDFMRTSQWSQRPHVASVAYYRRILESHFSQDSRCFIEDRMYGIVENSYRLDGIAGWNQHRLHIYMPHQGSIKRSYTTDGRAGEPKYDDTQIW